MTDLEKSAGREMLTGAQCQAAKFSFQKISVHSALLFSRVCAESAVSRAEYARGDAMLPLLF